MSATFLCGSRGCTRTVTGVYCPEHRGELQAVRDAARQERSERMKALRQDPEFMAKLAAGRAPAKG